jgi:hypothetical protein
MSRRVRVYDEARGTSLATVRSARQPVLFSLLAERLSHVGERDVIKRKGAWLAGDATRRCGVGGEG